MDFDRVRAREKEIAALWLPRTRADPPTYPCYDCCGDYMYEMTGVTLDGIRQAVSRWPEQEADYLLCREHWDRRNDREQEQIREAAASGNPDAIAMLEGDEECTFRFGRS